jgi:hypothetical protein
MAVDCGGEDGHVGMGRRELGDRGGQRIADAVRPRRFSQSIAAMAGPVAASDRRR